MIREKAKASRVENSCNQWIHIVGAREHNLKNVSVKIPKNTITVITGPSGSGKSSLALSVLFTEGKRRYMESLSSYARQFLGIAKKPDFDRIDGLCPAIAIEQKTVGSNPRSTVGTITEIYDYLRVLFARIGTAYCPDCAIPVKEQSAQETSNMIEQQFKGQTITIMAPLALEKKGEFIQLLTQHFAQGYYRFYIDGQMYRFNSEEDIKKIKLAKTYKHTISLIIDRLQVDPTESARLHEAVEKSFTLAKGLCTVVAGTAEHIYSSNRICLRCGISIPELEPRFFSFNSPLGACQECHGLGIIHEWPWQAGDPGSWKSDYPEHFSSHAQEKTCSSCQGKRLQKQALSIFINDKNIYDIGQLSIDKALEFFKNIRLSSSDYAIAKSLLLEITSRLQFLYNVGLSYLTLNRSARTLSGGEGQRIRLATQIGSALSGVLYILDEPSIGLHQRDNDRLIKTLKALRDQGNTVVVVEHDIDTMQQADYLIDMGPAAGILGGSVTAAGNPEALKNDKNSLTGAYLAGRRGILVPKKYRTLTKSLRLLGAQKNNLKNLTVSFPLQGLVCVSGVSGSGKSTLILDELVPAIAHALKKPSGVVSMETTGPKLQGVEHIQDLVVIDQSPIGRTSRSNPATYLGIFDDIRALFAQLPESMARGYKIGRFSFNVAEGRCFECKGDGTITVSMQFLADVVMTCKVCNGARYNQETLAITYKQKNIAQILDMTVHEALQFFAAHKQIAKRLQLVCDVGLDYIKLGQSSTTLSGGEAQRIKLVDELAKRGSNTLYVLDEPTTGLHTSDIEKLLQVFNRLIDKGNSMIVIEHNLDVLKTADHIIDLGPEGGSAGGTIIAQGTPLDIIKVKESHTATYLRPLLARK